ncbi:MAG TPA: hypothetical protein VMV54_06970 [Acidocella sp.]|nr:hypothetical protein [Acidocella sp.]
MRTRPAAQITRALRHPAACLLYLAAAWLFYAPPHDWSGLTYKGQGQDPLAFIWFLNWWPFALSHHLPLLFTHYVDAPVGVNLVWKTSVPALGLLAAPFTRHFGAVAVFNTLMLTAPALSAFGVYLAAYELTGAFAAALVAGAIFFCSGYEIGQSLGHLNLAFCIAVPLCVWACLRAAAHGWSTWRLGLVLGFLLLFEFGVSQEIFASLVLFGFFSLLAVFWLNPEKRETILHLLPGIGLGLLLCLLLASPFIWQMLRFYAAAQADLSSPDLYGNDLLSFITPTPLTFLGGEIFAPVTRLFAGNYSEEGGYFSFSLLALLGFIVWRGGAVVRAMGFILLLAAILSLGPYLHVLGFRLSTAPWILFYKLPFLGGILPGRMALYAWLAAAFLVALWLAAPETGWRRYAVAILCIGVLTPAQSFDRNWGHLDVPPVFNTLPEGAQVMVMPIFAQEMGWQYAANMRFDLVGQGYVGTGQPVPFVHWPFYLALWENRFTDIDPVEFSAYLAHYDVQDIVLLPHGYGFYGVPVNDALEFKAAAVLLQKAGWDVVSASPQAVLYQPGAAAGQHWSGQDVSKIMAQMTPEHRAKLIKSETRRVCEIREFARIMDLNPVPLLAFYAAHIHPLLPVDAIMCRHK